MSHYGASGSSTYGGLSGNQGRGDLVALIGKNQMLDDELDNMTEKIEDCQITPDIVNNLILTTAPVESLVYSCTNPFVHFMRKPTDSNYLFAFVSLYIQSLGGGFDYLWLVVLCPGVFMMNPFDESPFHVRKISVITEMLFKLKVHGDSAQLGDLLDTLNEVCLFGFVKWRSIMNELRISHSAFISSTSTADYDDDKSMVEDFICSTWKRFKIDIVAQVSNPVGTKFTVSDSRIHLRIWGLTSCDCDDYEEDICNKLGECGCGFRDLVWLQRFWHGNNNINVGKVIPLRQVGEMSE